MHDRFGKSLETREKKSFQGVAEAYLGGKRGHVPRAPNLGGADFEKKVKNKEYFCNFK